jgi:hypothetical protein
MFKKNFARFVTHWFAETWAAILANASALQTALLAFIGALVFFAAVGVAAPWVMPLALLTLGIVYLVEIAILTKMTKQGLAKFNGYFYKQADLGEHVIKVEDGDQLVALDEVQIEFYRSRADAYFSNSPQLADVNIDINAQPPELKPTLDLLYTNQQKLDLLLNHHVHHQLNTDVKELSAGRSTTYEAINDLKKSILQAIKGKCQTLISIFALPKSYSTNCMKKAIMSALGVISRSTNLHGSLSWIALRVWSRLSTMGVMNLSHHR